MNPYVPITDAFCTHFPGITPEDIVYSTPPSPEMGDLAIAMFPLSRKLKNAPANIAKEAVDSIEFGDLVDSAATAGPYVNLKLNRPVVIRSVVEHILREKNTYGSCNCGAGQRVILEHTSINPNASPHVGRARNAMIGDSLARLLRFQGHEVEVHYYVNDMGRQIGLLVLVAEELENLNFDQILAAYVEANQRAEQDPEFAEKGYDLLVRMEEGDPEVQRKFTAVTDLCLEGQLAVLARLGTSYDCFDKESKYVRDPRLEPVLAALREKDAVFIDDDERLVVDLSKLGYPHEQGRYFVLMRANGSSMYGYRDIAYSIDKEALGADINMMVLGEDHKLYAQQVQMILDVAGHSAPEPIYYAYILLKDGKMSTRQGKVVLLSDFLDQAAQLASERVAEQCRDISEEARNVIAEQVAVAAIRFAVLRVSPNKNVIFDMDAALSFTGDTGPYIQYSCARIQSILRKAEVEIPDIPSSDFPLVEQAEWQVTACLADFENVLQLAYEQRNVSGIGVYALELARQFTTFYHECPVLSAETPALSVARLQLCRAVLQTLNNALYLLGVEIPEKM